MATGKSNEDLVEKTFEHKWVIKDWMNVIQDEALIQNMHIEIQCEAENLELAKFMIGLKICQTGNERYIIFSWKLPCKPFYMDNVETHLIIHNVNILGNKSDTYESQENAVLQKNFDIEQLFWWLTPPAFCPTVWTDSEGSMVILVEIKLKNLPNVVCYSKSREFRKTCQDECSQNLAALLDNKLNSDLKLITKDKTEFFVHKAILCARCPVFASMFGSDFLESSTSVVYVDDVSAPTMKVLLKYWYTGELLPSWTDEDVIVEFTYAAGKYQMTHILHMLDYSIGNDFWVTDVHIDLLKMVQKLSLKNAESKSFKLVIDKITKVKNGTELLDIFSLTTNDIYEGNFTVSQVLKLFDDVLSENNDKEVCTHEIMLKVLACKNGVKNVESCYSNVLLTPLIR